MGRYWFLSKETKKKMSNSHLGKHHSKETKQKISKSRKGKCIGNKNPMKRPEIKKKFQGKNHPLWGKIGYWAGKKRPEISKRMKGKKLSEKTKKKISLALKRTFIKKNKKR